MSRLLVCYYWGMDVSLRIEEYIWNAPRRVDLAEALPPIWQKAFLSGDYQELFFDSERIGDRDGGDKEARLRNAEAWAVSYMEHSSVLESSSEGRVFHPEGRDAAFLAVLEDAARVADVDPMFLACRPAPYILRALNTVQPLKSLKLVPRHLLISREDASYIEKLSTLMTDATDRREFVRTLGNWYPIDIELASLGDTPELLESWKLAYEGFFGDCYRFGDSYLMHRNVLDSRKVADAKAEEVLGLPRSARQKLYLEIRTASEPHPFSYFEMRRDGIPEEYARAAG